MTGVHKEGVTVDALDGYRLAADLFEPVGKATRNVLIASALGVRRGLYAALAAYLAEGGMRVMTVDCRGIGGSRPPSLRGFQARLSDWAEQDLAGAARSLRARGPQLPLDWVGHSLGGQLMGLVPERPDKALFIASGSAYFGHWRGTGRLGMAGFFFGLVPVLTGAVGYLPMRALRQGEDVPRGAALQWAEWGRDPGYVLKYLKQRGGPARFDHPGPIRSYAFADDGYAPRASAQALLDAYGGGARELRWLRPEELGQRRIGHFGVFRQSTGEKVWTEARAWLLS